VQEIQLKRTGLIIIIVFSNYHFIYSRSHMSMGTIEFRKYVL